VHPSLIPLLRGTKCGEGAIGGTGDTRNLIRRIPEAEVAAFVEAIERAAASSDPKAMAAFLKDQHLAIGPTRITQSRAPFEKLDSVSQFLAPADLSRGPACLCA
jgi:hypothetical protein